MKKYISEFIGTFVLVTFGCGAAVSANGLMTMMGMPVPLAFTTLLIAFAFGLCIVAMAYSIGNVSGCHINPAVSIAMFITDKMDGKDLAGYLVSQFLGAIAGALLLWGITGQRESLGQNGFGEASAMGSTFMVACLVEIVLTFVFVLVILGVTSKKEFAGVAGLVIGFTLTLIHILGIPFTGTSVNPARSLGPAIVVGGEALKQVPLFIIAPIIGGILAALVFKLVIDEDGWKLVGESPAKAENAPEAAETKAAPETKAQAAAETKVETVAAPAAEAAPANTMVKEAKAGKKAFAKKPEKKAKAVAAKANSRVRSTRKAVRGE